MTKSIFGWPLVIIRLILAVTWFFIASIISLIVCIFRPFNVKNGYFFGYLCNPVMLWILGIKFIRPQIPYSTQDSYVFIANHQSVVDLFIFPLILPINTISIGKKSIRFVPIFGWVYWLSDHIFIDRANKTKAVKAMDEAGELIRKKKLSVIVFPEGTRVRSGSLGPFKKGAFHLASQCNFPLVPILATPYRNVLDYGRWNTGTIRVKYLDPIHPPFPPLDTLVENTHTLFLSELKDFH